MTIEALNKAIVETVPARVVVGLQEIRYAKVTVFPEYWVIVSSKAAEKRAKAAMKEVSTATERLGLIYAYFVVLAKRSSDIPKGTVLWP